MERRPLFPPAIFARTVRTKDVSTSATKEGDTAPCAVARLAHPGCWVSPRMVHIGVMPTILPFSQKKNSHGRLEPQKARTNARNGATAVFSATFVLFSVWTSLDQSHLSHQHFWTSLVQERGVQSKIVYKKYCKHCMCGLYHFTETAGALGDLSERVSVIIVEHDGG